MLLAIDVGNTHTTLGLFEGAELGASWRVSTIASRTPDEYRIWLSGLFSVDGVDTGAIQGVAISSVVPAATSALRLVSRSMVSGGALVVGPGVRTGMPIAIDNPREVGADRVANSVAAAARYGTPAIVVDFGTATTVDVIDAEGAYIGGVISPGIEVSVEALVESTAALRRVELAAPRSVVGKSTVEAIQSGVVLGYAGMVDGLVDRIEREVGAAAKVATGGLAPTIVPHCRTVAEVDPYLTLHGLRLIYERNTSDH